MQSRWALLFPAGHCPVPFSKIRSLRPQ